VKYCNSVCTDGAPFDGTGKRGLIRMFRWKYSYIHVDFIKRRTRNINFTLNLTNQVRNDVVMKIIISRYNKKLSKC